MARSTDDKQVWIKNEIAADVQKKQQELGFRGSFAAFVETILWWYLQGVLVNRDELWKMAYELYQKDQAQLSQANQANKNVSVVQGEISAPFPLGNQKLTDRKKRRRA